MSQRHIYLVRHGQQATPGAAPHPLGNGLTALGRQQARRLARRLATLPVNVIHFSTLRRAAETAGFIAAQLPDVPVRPSRALWEIPAANILPAFAHWYGTVTPDQVAQGRARAEAVFQRLFRPVRGRERHEVVVCHGNLIRFCVCQAFHMAPEAWVNLDPHNAGLTEIVVERDGRLRLLSFNDVGHLPPPLRTFL